MIRCEYCGRICWPWQRIGRNKSGFAHIHCAAVALKASLDVLDIAGIETTRWRFTP